MKMEPYVFGDSTPGQRMAARGSTASRPGHPDYIDEELRALCGSLASNPGVQSLLGTGDLVVTVARDRKCKTLMFVVGA